MKSDGATIVRNIPECLSAGVVNPLSRVQSHKQSPKKSPKQSLTQSPIQSHVQKHKYFAYTMQ